MNNNDPRLNPIEAFRRLIVLGDGMSLTQYAWHEAGHMLMWRLHNPQTDVKLRLQDGCPCVAPAREHKIKLSTITRKRASLLAAVKMGGVCGEIVQLELQEHVPLFARWILADMASPTPSVDWADDAAHGGDIPDTIAIITAAVGPQSVTQNFPLVMEAVIRGIMANLPQMRRIVEANRQTLGKWRMQGLWRP